MGGGAAGKKRQPEETAVIFVLGLLEGTWGLGMGLSVEDRDHYLFCNILCSFPHRTPHGQEAMKSVHTAW
jgi:hypothetical protein